MNPTIRALDRRLRLGVVGGGPGSFIGPVHRTAARIDDRYELLAAVLSSNPARARAAARDIGTHAHHLGAFVTGLDLDRVTAAVGAVVPGRVADDTAHVLLRYANSARGAMWVTQAAPGAEHGLSFRVFGETGGLEWQQEQPNRLLHRRLNDFPQLLTRRLDGQLAPEATRAAPVEIGHPEGYQEAFATLYREAADAIVARRTGTPCDPMALDFPTALEAPRG